VYTQLDKYAVVLIKKTVKDVIDEVRPKHAYPVVRLDRPINRQVHLYATDKVHVYGPEDVEAIDVGLGWQRISPYHDRPFLVRGVPRVPVIPKFRTKKGATSVSVKLHIVYSAYRDRPRDVREGDLDKEKKP
jgi:hypothetical protein